mgnify:CR=1 FL=1
MPLHMSVSSIQNFLACRRLYYYSRIKKYEKIQYNLPFIVGRVVNEGLAYVLGKKPNAIELMTKYYKTERAKAIKEFTLSPEQLEKLNMQELVTRGMLLAYQTKYGKMIRDIQLLGSEVEGAVEVADNIVLVIKMDNIVRIRGKKILHELKTSKQITPDYVARIRTDLQSSTYFYVHNIIFEKEPIQEIMYDVIRKPSIKQKKKETKDEYAKRLVEWYQKPDDMGGVFHIERFTKPGISEDDVINTISQVGKEMLRCKEKEDYYMDFDKCHSYFGDVCPMYDLCHNGGESKENLLLYTIRKPFHVSKENKGVGK